MAITWTKYWTGADDGTTLKGVDLKNIQDDLGNVLTSSDIGSTVQAYDEGTTTVCYEGAVVCYEEAVVTI